MKNCLKILWEKTKPLVIPLTREEHDLSNALRSMILENPTDPGLLVKLGSYLVSRYLYCEEAYYYLERAIKLDPENWEAYFWKALILFFEYKHYSDANHALNKALALKPEKACLLQLKGFVLLELENKPSDEYFKKTVYLEPGWLLSRVQLMYFSIQSQALDVAINEINTIKKLISYIKNNPPVTSSLKESYYETYITGRIALNQIEEFIDGNSAQLVRFVDFQ